VSGLQNKPDHPYPADGTRRDAWWKTLVVDSVNSEEKHSEIEIPAFELVGTVMSHLDLNFDLQLSKECKDMIRNPSREDIVQFFERTTRRIWGTLPHMLHNRRFFLTEKGYFGFSRDGLQVGDLIFLLPNCLGLVIMREVDRRFHSDSEFDGESLEGYPIHN